MARKLHFFFILISTFSLVSIQAQNCFQIESILVNACGADEGLNEMVRFRVGNTALNVNNISITWATVGMPWTGTVKNATTASKVSQMNAQVQNCGLFLEPPTNMLPANAIVFLITSYNVDVSAHSFAGLSDTIYVIFQNKNVTQGHFANAPNSARTFSLNFTGCTAQSVTYTNAIPDVDGATINVNSQGAISYSSPGCVVPVTPFTIDAGNTQAACQGQTINLNGAVTGSYTQLNWFGGTGSFSSPSTTSTQYTVGNNENDPIVLYFSATNCNNITRLDSVFITNNSPQVTITEGGFIGTCQTTPLTLHATGNGTISWPGISTTANATVSNSGQYLAIATNACGTDSAFITVAFEPTPTILLPNDTTMCQNDNLLLDASYPNATYLWQDNSTNATYNVTQAGTYSVTVTNQCGNSTTASVNVQYGAGPQHVLTDTTLSCSGLITLDAQNPGATYLWNTLATSQTIQVNQEATYSVQIILCGDTIVDSVKVTNTSLDQLKNQIPNVFSPNNDGTNDTYQIPVNPADIDQFNFAVYNRWGFLVFSSQQANFVWDGTFNNQTVSSGTYFYVIQMIQNCDIPKKFEHKGTITVFN